MASLDSSNVHALSMVCDGQAPSQTVAWRRKSSRDRFYVGNVSIMRHWQRISLRDGLVGRRVAPLRKPPDVGQNKNAATW
jgi:hypothetical protein